MDTYQIIVVAIGAFNVIAAMIITPLVSRVRDLEKEITAHQKALLTYQTYASNQFVSKTELKDHLTRIEQTLAEIKTYFMSKQKND